MFTHSLSFQVRIARTSRDLQEARRVRALSYGHHLPSMGAEMLKPDSFDTRIDTYVAVCVDKTSKAVVGTARFQTNSHGPLQIERSMTLPESMSTDSRAEVSRLSAIRGSDPMVTLALMKASYLFCAAKQVRWLVICARSVALLRTYEKLGFKNLFGDGHVLPMKHVGNLDHHVLALNLTTVESDWRAAGNPLYQFIFDTTHPDINLMPLPEVELDIELDVAESYESSNRPGVTMSQTAHDHATLQ